MIDRTRFVPVARALLLVGLAALVAGCAAGRPTSAPEEGAGGAPEAPGAPAPVVAIPNARRPLEGVLTGGQPTPEQIDEAAAAGYRAVVNLRSSLEEGFEWERERVEAAGMRYVQIEVAGAAGLTRENVARLTELLSDPTTRPMMLHCKSGNRVGALLALKAAWIDGVPDDEALSLGLEAGLTRLEPKTKELLAED